MKKKLIKKCNKPVDKKQREWGMLIIGQQAFGQVPKRDIPMFSLKEGRIIK